MQVNWSINVHDRCLISGFYKSLPLRRKSLGSDAGRVFAQNKSWYKINWFLMASASILDHTRATSPDWSLCHLIQAVNNFKKRLNSVIAYLNLDNLKHLDSVMMVILRPYRSFVTLIKSLNVWIESFWSICLSFVS